MTLQEQIESGLSHHQAGRLAEAEKIYRHILSHSPDQVETLHLLGVLASQVGNTDAAVELIQRAVRLKPDYAEAHGSLGDALHAKGQLDQAIASYREAIQINPDLAAAHNNLGNALRESGRLEEAIASYQQAIQLKPDIAMVHNNLGTALKDTGRLDQAIFAFRRAIQIKPDYAVGHSNLVFTLQYQPGCDGKLIYDELRRWNQQHAQPLKKFIQTHTNNRNPDRRLRIGYLSPDFRNHPVGQNLLPLFREHEHSQMEIVCYSNVVRGDAITEQYRRYADVWRNILPLSDLQAVDLIRQDRIDILVDLALHLAGNRLPIFACKPAPVQATFAGYPGSTGLDTIDYRLTDPHLDAPGLNDQFCSETSIRLPDSFWCYDPIITEPAVNPLPAQSQGFVTFGCLSNFCKVNEPVLRLWAQVLKTVNESRLMLLCPEGSHRQSILELLRREGIRLDRIELVASRPRTKYLELYNRIDVGLDTFPYNGHTTSLDSLWMGVPVVTLVGQTVVGRAGLSQLTNLGLPEMVASTPEQYVRIAVGLANDLPRLAELRRTLRPRMQASPLMDAPRFARNIETAFRKMWRIWCEQSEKSGLQYPPT